MGSRRTIAHLAYDQSQKYGDRLAHHHPENGRWVPLTWRQSYSENSEISAGLWELGCRKGDKIAIISQTRYEWATVDLAILGFGGIVVGIYPTSTPEQIAYILKHSESRLVVIEDAVQLDNLRAVRDRLPHVEHVVIIQPEDAADDAMALTDLRSKGRALLERQPAWAETQRHRVEPTDVASLVYTSGTTGPPKGVVLTHANFYEIAERTARHVDVDDSDVGIAFLPMAHSLQRVAMYAGLYAGVASYFAESLDKLPEVWQAAQPTTLSSVPRIFEKIHTKIMSGLAEQPPRRRKIFEAAMRVGRARSQCIQKKHPIPIGLRLRYAFFDRLIFRKLRARLFGSRVRYLTSGGAPLSLELAEFFHAMGLLILEGYGLTETSAPATVNQPHDFKFGTVGKVLPDVEIRIADDGEILIRGPGNFREYFKEPAATREVVDDDGWFKSGDIGELDDEGFLRITDRKKDIIITAGGKNIAPQNIENLIKTDPRISQVMVYGDKRPYLVALVTLDPEEMQAWAERAGMADASMDALAHHPDVERMVAGIVEEKNASLARYESIKKFRITPEEFTVDNDQLTPTLKPKRRVIIDRYGDLIEEMYAG